MRTILIERAKNYAKRFSSTILKNEKNTDDYHWLKNFELDNDEDEGKIFSNVGYLLDSEEENTIIKYFITRDNKCRYSYDVMFEFNDEYFINSESKEFDELVDAINMCEDGLFDKICTYLHELAMEQIYCDEDAYDWNIVYEEEYTPSRIKNFMKKYGVSKYVPIDIEVVDEKGYIIKKLSIKDVGFNDEANRLIIMTRENLTED